MNSTLECFHCFEQYMYEESKATIPYMYCSVECENAEEARLKEGNEIVKAALEANPLFEQEARHQDLKHLSLNGILNFVKKEKAQNEK